MIDLFDTKMRARPVAAALVAVVFSVPVKAIDVGMHLEQVAACQAWSSAVIKSPEAVPQEWVAWTYALMSTAVATPLNDDWSPFQKNAHYQEHLRAIRKTFGDSLPSPNSAAHVAARESFMTLVEALRKESQQKEGP